MTDQMITSSTMGQMMQLPCAPSIKFNLAGATVFVNFRSFNNLQDLETVEGLIKIIRTFYR